MTKRYMADRDFSVSDPRARDLRHHPQPLVPYQRPRTRLQRRPHPSPPPRAGEGI